MNHGKVNNLVNPIPSGVGGNGTQRGNVVTQQEAADLHHRVLGAKYASAGMGFGLAHRDS